MSSEVTPPSNSKPVDIDGCAALYVEVRDQITALKAKLKEETAPLNKALEELDVILLKALQEQGAKSIKTPSGTVYQRVERSATIKDKKLFRDFVIENAAWDLIDWRASKVEVFSHIEEKKEEVPGVNTSAFMTIGVRRGAAQED